MRTARRLLAGLMVVAALCATTAEAQTFPTRVVKIVVPIPPGAAVDASARIVAEELGKVFGQNVIVENVVGASGALGARQVAKAEPDGHTIIYGNSQSHGANMFMFREPGYDAVKDFVPLAGVAAHEHVFVVPSASPVRSIQDLVDLARKEPGKLNYGSTGLGGGTHLTMEMFMLRTGTRLTHVPFRGAAAMVQELVAGRLDVTSTSLASVLGQIQGNQVRAIGLASLKRSSFIPDVPTLREQGVSDAEAESWVAYFAPVNTPKPILDKLSGAIIATLNKPEVQERLTKLGFTLNIRTPAQFGPYHAKEQEIWAEVVRITNLKVESEP